MFGYIRYDLPNLFVKDYELYRSAYCGLCKGIGKSCGLTARMGLTYDMTFLSVLFHNLKGVDFTIERQHCLEHCIGKRPMAVVDELTKQLGALNTILTYHKLTDDIVDGDKGRGKRVWFKRGYKRAKKTYPKLDEIVSRNLKEQACLEKRGVSSLDMASDSTANMMKELSDEILGADKSKASGELFYALGKWIYLIDALDDYDKDKKKGAYNPFVLTYQADCLKALMEGNGKEISFLFDTVFYALRESLSKLTFHFNRDLTDNVLLRGLPLETARVMQGECRCGEKPNVKIK